MPKIRNRETGQVSDVSMATAQKAIQTGQYDIEKGKYNIKRGDEVFSVEATELPNVLQHGFRLETSEETRARTLETKYGDRDVSAALAGAARGVTFGISDQIMTKALGVKKDTLANLKEANPYSSAAGELGGIGASIIATGGIGAAGQAGVKVGGRLTAKAIARSAVSGPGVLARGSQRVGQETAKKLIGQVAGETLKRQAARKALQLGTEGALEGAAYGAAQLVSEEALGRAELSAENLLASAGMGALLGAGVGGVLGGGSKLIAPSINKSAKAIGAGVRKSIDTVTPFSLSREGLEEVAEQSALKATGARGSDIRRLKTESRVRQVGRDLLDYTDDEGNRLFKAGMDADELAEKLPKARAQVGNKLGNIRDKVDDYIQANTQQRAVQFDKKALKGKGIDDLMKMAPEPADDLQPDVMSMFRRVYDDVLAPLRASDTPGVQKLSKKVEKQFEPLLKSYLKGETVDLKRLTSFRKDIDKMIYKKPTTGGIAVAPQAAEQLQQARGVLEDFIEEHTEKVLRTMGEDMTQYAKTKQMFASLRTAEDLAKKASLQDLGNRAISPSDYGTGLMAGGVGGILAGGPFGLMTAAAAAGAHKVVRERGRSVAALVADSLAKRMHVAKVNAKVDSRVVKAVHSILSASPAKSVTLGTKAAIEATRPSQLVASVNQDSYQETLDKLAKFSNPETVAERIDQNLTGAKEALPKTTAALAQKGSTAAQFLLSKAPKPPGHENSLTPLANKKWKPTKAELSKFKRYLKGVENPLAVLDDLAEGKVSREAVEAMKVVYPELYERTRFELAQQAGKLEEKLSYDKLIRLSVFFDVPLDRALTPAYLQAVQSTYADNPTDGQGGGGTRVTGIDNIDIAKDYRSDAQSLASSL